VKTCDMLKISNKTSAEHSNPTVKLAEGRRHRKFIGCQHDT